MQIYTKILLGMGVGAAIGLTIGPNSPFLAHDVYKIDDPSQLTLRLDRDDSSSAVGFPKTVTRFRVLETVAEERIDKAGNRHSVPTWSQVRVLYDKNLVMRDPSGKLRQALGEPTVGDTVTLWMRIRATELESGGFSEYPQPISGIGDTVMVWLSPLGVLFMRLIKMVIVPLVFASLLVGVASLGDIRRLGRLGGRTLGLYICTTAIAVTIGLLCANVVGPGEFVNEASRARLQAQFMTAAGTKVQQAAESPSMVENILRIVPENPLASLAGGNMLQIIFFATILGIALTLLPDNGGSPVVIFFDRIQHAMVLVIHGVMALAPYGVAALVAEVVGMSGLSVLASLLVYSLAVIFGLGLHLVLVYGGLAKFVAGVRWRPFMRAIRPAQLIAFSTSSSSATLPVTMECAEENLGVSQPVSSFVLPLGSTINMDGTALYQGVAAVFIAQVFQIDLSVGAQLGIVLTATMASVGAAGVPGAGMVTLAMVLTSAGIPTVGVALILGMDRILDMFRTAVNVTGDLTVTTVMAVREGERLRQ